MHVYSSRNLTDWRDEGIALAVTTDPTSDIVKDAIIERPKVVYNSRTGKFVMVVRWRERWSLADFDALPCAGTRAPAAGTASK